MPPKSKPTYHALDTRLGTFSEARIQGVKGRSKKAFNSWPHERPSALSLAEAGFYYNPLPDSNDNATCFLCNRSLDGWEAQDIPADEHNAHSKDCAWAILRSKPWNGMDIETLKGSDLNPNSDLSLNCRLETFSEWPHEKKKGWNPTGLIMAKAGFYYNPVRPGDDIATCCYCDIDLDGWEPKDDPIEEHKRRSPDCLCLLPSLEIHIAADISSESASSQYLSFTSDEDRIVLPKGNGNKRLASQVDLAGPVRKLSRTEDLRIASTSSNSTVKLGPSTSQLHFEPVEDECEPVEDGLEHKHGDEHLEHAIKEPSQSTEYPITSDSDDSQLSISSSITSTTEESIHMPGAFPKQKSKINKKPKRTRKVQSPDQTTPQIPQVELAINSETVEKGVIAAYSPEPNSEQSSRLSVYESFSNSPPPEPTTEEMPNKQDSEPRLDKSAEAEDISMIDESDNWKRFSSSSYSTQRLAAPVFYQDNNKEAAESKSSHSDNSGPSTPISSRSSWAIADLDAVFSVINEYAESDFAQNTVGIKEEDKDKSLLDWTSSLASQGEELLKQKCEDIIKILKHEGERAIQALEQMPVKS